MPERARGFGGDMLAISWQVAVAVGLPLLGAAWLSQQVTQDVGGQLVVITLGLAVAGAGMYGVIRRYLERHPVGPTTDVARKAGQQWEREVAERERRRERQESGE
jgi:hypothetical protein